MSRTRTLMITAAVLGLPIADVYAVHVARVAVAAPTWEHVAYAVVAVAVALSTVVAFGQAIMAMVRTIDADLERELNADLGAELS